MKVHSAEKIKELLSLRRKGNSINELVSKTGLPKTTIWHHVHEIKLHEKYRAKIRSNQGGSFKRKEENIKRAAEYASQIFSGKDRELALVIAMLYWAEGSKKVCEFINSDGKMIALYLYILRTVFRIPEIQIKPTMRIFSGMSRSQSLHYWSNITGIPKYRFIIRLNDGGLRGRTKYGMCRITVKKGAQILKVIHSLIGQIYSGIVRV